MRVGMSPNEVDDTEIWMVASAIGANRIEKDAVASGGTEEGRDPLLAERVRAAKEGRRLDPKSMRWGQPVSDVPKRKGA